MPISYGLRSALLRLHRRSCLRARSILPERGGFGALAPAWALAVAWALAACGTLPPEALQQASHPTTALAAPAGSALATMARASTPSPDQSGVRLMPLGSYSLDARVQLIDRASSSLDLQYYEIANDSTGRLLLRKLRDAALRGVRVRLLVDDIYTEHTDALLRGLAAFPNVEVRLFNPFCCARSGGVVARFAASLLDFERLNHRMHNKLFIADSVMAVVGGRNIADEYFLRNPSQNFVDMDAFVMGAVVGEMSAIFDRYWNSEVVRDIRTVDAPVADAAQAQAAFSADIEGGAPSAWPDPPPVDALGYGPLREEFEAGRIGLVWGTARAFADPPDKIVKKTPEERFATSVTNDVMMTLWRAERELVITSPYLIPGERGMKAIEDLRSRGVKITIMTNSLAATDEPLVHNGYSAYRYQMLQAGVDLFELSPTLTRNTKRLGMFGSSLGRLHAKTAVVDRKTVFLGSMNLDPRSARSNTEFGMFVESPAVAKELLRIVNIAKVEGAYRVRIGPGGTHVQWLAVEGEQQVILDNEPESTWWLRLHNLVFGWFVPRELL